MTKWTLFIFVGSYPFKRGNPEPEHHLVLVDSDFGEARERYYEEKGAYPEAHGMANFTDVTKQDVWNKALNSGYVIGVRGSDRDVDVVFRSRKQALLLARKAARPANDGLYCLGPCGSYFTYVEPNQSDGKSYVCPDCRPKVKKKAS